MKVISQSEPSGLDVKFSSQSSAFRKFFTPKMSIMTHNINGIPKILCTICRYLSSAEKKPEILVTSSKAELTNSFHL